MYVAYVVLIIMHAFLNGCSGLMHAYVRTFVQTYVCTYVHGHSRPQLFLIWFKQCVLKPSSGYRLCDCDFEDDSVTTQ